MNQGRDKSPPELDFLQNVIAGVVYDLWSGFILCCCLTTRELSREYLVCDSISGFNISDNSGNDLGNSFESQCHFYQFQTSPFHDPCFQSEAPSATCFLSCLAENMSSTTSVQNSLISNRRYISLLLSPLITDIARSMTTRIGYCRSFCSPACFPSRRRGFSTLSHRFSTFRSRYSSSRHFSVWILHSILASFPSH